MYGGFAITLSTFGVVAFIAAVCGSYCGVKLGDSLCDGLVDTIFSKFFGIGSEKKRKRKANCCSIFIFSI